jgi:hypothetical protein
LVSRDSSGDAANRTPSRFFEAYRLKKDGNEPTDRVPAALPSVTHSSVSKFGDTGNMTLAPATTAASVRQ